MTDPRQFLQEWPGPTERELRLLAIADEYHRACDAFDDATCSVVFEGESIPVTSYERRAVIRNASRVRQSLIERHNLTPSEFREALKLYSGQRAHQQVTGQRHSLSH